MPPPDVVPPPRPREVGRDPECALRVPQWTLVPKSASRTHRDRKLAQGVQRGAAEEGVGRTDTRRLRRAVKV